MENTDKSAIDIVPILDSKPEPVSTSAMAPVPVLAPEPVQTYLAQSPYISDNIVIDLSTIKPNMKNTILSMCDNYIIDSSSSTSILNRTPNSSHLDVSGQPQNTFTSASASPLPNTPFEIELYNYKDVDKALTESYNSQMNANYSTICDIIAVYLKGQKILYTEAKTVCEQRLTSLMLPAIFLTVLCSILSLILAHIQYGNLIVSGLGGITTFILALINYLKLDARAEAHRMSAYKFDKLQSFVEFNSGKLLFVPFNNTALKDVISKTEEIVSEIKETNQFVLPEKVRYTYPNLYSMNVFAEVKKLQHKEMECTNKIKDIINEIIILKADNINMVKEIKTKIQLLETEKKNLTNEIIRMKNEYLLLDHHFDKEVALARDTSIKNYAYYNCDCFKV